MQAIKLVTGVTPTCWRPPYGDVDVRSTFPHSLEYRNIDLTFSVGIGPHSIYCKSTGFADYHMEV